MAKLIGGGKSIMAAKSGEAKISASSISMEA